MRWQVMRNDPHFSKLRAAIARKQRAAKGYSLGEFKDTFAVYDRDGSGTVGMTDFKRASGAEAERTHRRHASAPGRQSR